MDTNSDVLHRQKRQTASFLAVVAPIQIVCPTIPHASKLVNIGLTQRLRWQDKRDWRDEEETDWRYSFLARLPVSSFLQSEHSAHCAMFACA